jgi:hypothetical protein
MPQFRMVAYKLYLTTLLLTSIGGGGVFLYNTIVAIHDTYIYKELLSGSPPMASSKGGTNQSTPKRQKSDRKKSRVDDFDPDKWLAEKRGTVKSVSEEFDPDEYLAEKRRTVKEASDKFAPDTFGKQFHKPPTWDETEPLAQRESEQNVSSLYWGDVDYRTRPIFVILISSLAFLPAIMLVLFRRWFLWLMRDQ